MRVDYLIEQIINEIDLANSEIYKTHKFIDYEKRTYVFDKI